MIEGEKTMYHYVLVDQNHIMAQISVCYTQFCQ
jgi:hypothetical protein